MGDQGVFSNKKGVFSVKQELCSHVMAVSFISGGNQSTWRKPPTCGE
jgi:hypothetical protein